MSERLNNTDLSQLIAENFGANATYVEGLLSRFRSDPSLVDESWRAYFAELLGNDATAPAARAPEAADNGRAATTPVAAAPAVDVAPGVATWRSERQGSLPCSRRS